MNIPAELKYTKDHEWIRLEDNIATIGITDHAQSELGEIVYVECDALDDECSKRKLDTWHMLPNSSTNQNKTNI